MCGEATKLGPSYMELEARCAAAEAEVARLREKAHDMVREWRLHGQLADSCRPMERLLGIHAPFCPVHSGGVCECDLALSPGDEVAR